MKPNILMIMSDQHGARWTGAYGDDYIKTPNLDRLASRGTLFENAYTTCPICVPARMSFMTSRYVSDIEIWDNNTILPSETRTWAHALREVGYDVVLNGKMHFRGPDKLHGFRAQLSGDPAGENDRSAPVPDWANGRVPGHSMPAMKKYGVLPDEAGDTDNVAERAAIDYIRARADADGPWCMCLGFAGPHPAWRVEQRYLDLYPLESVPMPAIPEGHLEGQSPLHKRNREMHGMVSDRYPDHDVRRARQAYFAKISRVDDMIGRVLDELGRTGQADNTVVIYTSDHGEMAGEHGLWHKHCFYEESAHIPLIVRLPMGARGSTAVAGEGTAGGGARRPQLASLVDVTDTLIDLADARPLAGSRGRSLLPAVHDETASTRSEAFSEYYATWIDRASAMLRRGNYKLSYSLGDPIELYNLAADPRELENLADRPEYAHVQAELTGALLDRWAPEEINRRVLVSQAERLAAAGAGD
jgi:choline-sulfatase